MTPNKSYSKKLKESAIQDYLEGVGSLEDVIIKYYTSSRQVLRGWIDKYNRLETIRDYDPKGEVYTTKGKKKQRLKNVKKLSYIVLNTILIITGPSRTTVFQMPK